MRKLLFTLLILAIVYFGVVLWFRDPNVNMRLDFDKLKSDSLHFGKDFLWGSATAAHQVEGNCTNNNWFQFESAVDEHGKPQILNGQKAGMACDHWQRYKEDIQLMKALSLNAYRFSVEWSKIEPKPGEFDEAVLDHYEQLVDELLANGIEPMVTLHHFTNPIWFEEQGAFLQEDSPDIFVRFVEHVVQRLGPKVKLWCTINEPSIYAVLGYFTAEWPPAVKDPQKAAIVFRNLLRAHTAAYTAIKRLEPQAQVGLVVYMGTYDPPNQWYLLDVVVAYLLNKNLTESHFPYLVDGRFDFSMPGLANESYTSGVKEAFDFVGLNYYTHFHRRFNPFSQEQFVEITRAPPEKLTDMGYEIYPEGLYRALKLITGYTSKPIYITENGIADDSDTKRAKFIEDHLLVVNKAISEGMNVKGCFYWSLMDNFEWAYGFERRFGLYHVDYSTQERTLRQGSRIYLEMIQKSKESGVK
ncbi:MAG: glycosyl hydrolase family protein [Chloroflexi bacterium]|nr:glycosyl hydrolase family protein [Chloroflexota bacterium]